jgi:hypothetical protein
MARYVLQILLVMRKGGDFSGHVLKERVGCFHGDFSGHVLKERVGCFHGDFSGHVLKERVGCFHRNFPKKLGPELEARNHPPFHDKLFNPHSCPQERGNHTIEK